MSIKFQCISWHAGDRATEDSDEEDESSAHYMIYIFGRQQNGQSVCVKFNFNPYFFVEIPKDWDVNKIQFFKSAFIREMKYLKDDVISIEPVQRKKFFGFTNKEDFKFLRIIFKTKKAYTRANYMLAKPLAMAIGSKLFQT